MPSVVINAPVLYPFINLRKRQLSTALGAFFDVLRFNIPEGGVDNIAECIVAFNLIVNKEDMTTYAATSFDIDVK